MWGWAKRLFRRDGCRDFKRSRPFDSTNKYRFFACAIGDVQILNEVQAMIVFNVQRMLGDRDGEGRFGPMEQTSAQKKRRAQWLTVSRIHSLDGCANPRSWKQRVLA